MEISELSKRIKHEDVIKFVELLIYNLNRIKTNGLMEIHNLRSLRLKLEIITTRKLKKYSAINFQKLEKQDPDLYKTLMELIHKANTKYWYHHVKSWETTKIVSLFLRKYFVNTNKLTTAGELSY